MEICLVWGCHASHIPILVCCLHLRRNLALFVCRFGTCHQGVPAVVNIVPEFGCRRDLQPTQLVDPRRKPNSLTLMLQFRYPSSDEIDDPSTKLPREFVLSFDEKIREAQRQYRELRRRPEGVLERDLVAVLVALATAALNGLADLDGPHDTADELRRTLIDRARTGFGLVG